MAAHTWPLTVGTEINVGDTLAGLIGYLSPQHGIYALAANGSRQIVQRTAWGSESSLMSSVRRLSDANPGSKIYYSGDWDYSFRDGYYWTYDLQNTVPDPINQVPYLYDPKYGNWMVEICEIAHEIADHKWEAYQMAQQFSWQHGPLTPHTTESHHRNRVALVYARAIAGYAFSKLSNWESLPGDGTHWRNLKAETEELITQVCGTCDGRNFSNQLVANMSSPDEWEQALIAVHELIIPPNSNVPEGTVIDYQRLPVIDRSNPNSWTLHPTENITRYSRNLEDRINRKWFDEQSERWHNAYLKYLSDPAARRHG